MAKECGFLIGRITIAGQGWSRPIAVYCTKPEGHHLAKVHWTKEAGTPGVDIRLGEGMPTATQMAEAGFYLRGDAHEFRNNGLVIRREEDVK